MFQFKLQLADAVETFSMIVHRESYVRAAPGHHYPVHHEVTVFRVLFELVQPGLEIGSIGGYRTSKPNYLIEPFELLCRPERRMA